MVRGLQLLGGLVLAVGFGGAGLALVGSPQAGDPGPAVLWAFRAFVGCSFGTLALAGVYLVYRAVVPERLDVPGLARERWTPGEGARWVLHQGDPRPRQGVFAGLMLGAAFAGVMLVAQGLTGDGSLPWRGLQLGIGAVCAVGGAAAVSGVVGLVREETRTPRRVWHGLGAHGAPEVVVVRHGTRLQLRGTTGRPASEADVQGALVQVPEALRVALEARAARGELEIRGIWRVRWTWQPPADELESASLVVWVRPGAEPAPEEELAALWRDAPTLDDVVDAWSADAAVRAALSGA